MDADSTDDGRIDDGHMDAEGANADLGCTGAKRTDAEGAEGPDADHNVSVGLVLGAGGASAEAWHAGVLRALRDATGWDARSAELIAGTSAGAITGLCLRAGIGPADLYAIQLGEPPGDEAQRILDRVVTPYSEGRHDRALIDHRPQSPGMAARAVWPPWQARVVHAAVGLLPRGTLTTEAFGQRLHEMHPEPWPSARFWVVAVRLRDGERVVFGRDDIEASAAEAVRASCAVPSRYEPVAVAGHRYVDGGVHSATNADLLGPPAFDAVVVSSAMSGDPGWSRVRTGLSEALSSVRSGLGPGADRPDAGTGWCAEALSHAWCDGRALRAGRRQWMGDKLREEVAGLRRRGSRVLVVEPGADAVELMDGSRSGGGGGAPRAEIAALACETAQRELAGDGELLAELLRRSAVSPVRANP